MKKSILTGLYLLALAAAPANIIAQSKSARISANDQSIINFSDGQKTYQLKLSGEKITELYIDGKKIPPEEFKKYGADIDKMRKQVNEDKIMAELDRKAAEMDRKMALRNKEMAELDAIEARKNMEEVRMEMEEARKEAIIAREEIKEAVRVARETEENRINFEEDREQAELDQIQAKKDMEQARIDMVQAEKDAAQAREDVKRSEEDQKTLKALINSLIKDKIVSGSDELTDLSLSEKEMRVNGRLLSAAICEKYASAYLKSRKDRIRFRHNDRKRSFSIEKDDSDNP